MTTTSDIVRSELARIRRMRQAREADEQPKPNGHDKATTASSLVAVPLSAIDGAALPRRPWIVPGLLMRRHVTVLVAPAGSGKSLLTIQIALACAAGMTWNGWRPRAKARVLIINAEEDGDELRRRVFAACIAMEITDDDIEDRLFFLDAQTSIVIAKFDARTRMIVEQPMLKQITELIRSLQIDIVIVDPLAETFEGDENNNELKWCAVLWRRVARETNAALTLVHHTKKYAHDMAGDPDAGRGGSALIGVARIVATLFTMSKDEAEPLGIKEEDRIKYLRFDDAKTNLTLVNHKTRWLKKVTKTLPNAGSNGEPADEIGVLEPCSAPDALDGIETPTVHKILDEIEIGVRRDDGTPTGDPYSYYSNSGERWAVPLVQKFTQCSEQRGRAILKTWIDNGMIKEIERPIAASKGKPRNCLKVIARPGVIESAT